jgi:RNA polymerase sigma-70 factor (ECF subfamily)
VRNRCLDKLRRQPKGIVDLQPEEWENLIADNIEPLDQAIADADAKRLSKCLDHLDENQRQSLVLAYFQGFSHSELAKQLSAPLGTAKAWVRRGLEKLKGCLQL